MIKQDILPVSFGTSGHRGIIGDSFTNQHVEAIAVGVSTLFHNIKKPTIVIGFDPRHGNDINYSEDSYTHTLIKTLNKYGINTISYNDFVPTPLISWAIRHYNYNGGLILTASHNPPEYNGIKFNPENGAPAPKHITNQIEEAANAFLTNSKHTFSKEKGSHRQLNAPTKEFSQSLKQSISTLGLPIPNTFSKSCFIDVKHGACGSTWQSISTEFNLPITLTHKEPKSDFGFIEPNPTKYTHLQQVNSSFYFSAANDPDGDRHAVLDTDGNPVSPEEITAILASYLIRKGHPIHSITSTLASSHLIKACCKKFNITYHETAVGFKYFSPILEEAHSTKKCCLAVESSGGFSTSFHTFEKCGFLPILALAILCDIEQQPLSWFKNQLYQDFPTFYFTESEYQFKPTKKNLITAFLNSTTIEKLTLLTDIPISSINQTDGLKIEFSNGWGLCRLSGTEPLARIYSEATSKEDSQKLNQTMTFLLNSI